MPDRPDTWVSLLNYLRDIAPFGILAIITGILDYVRGIQLKKHVFSIAGMIIHLSWAAVGGAMAGGVAISFDYHLYIAMAVAGVAGALNTQIADMIKPAIRKRFGVADAGKTD